VGISAPRAWAVGGAYTANTAVVVSPPRRGVFLGSANRGCPARMAVVVSPPRRGVSLAFANGVGPARTAVVLTPPLLAYAGCAGSDNGGGVLAASLLPLVMDLGSGVGDGPVRTAVGFSSPRSGVSLAFANRVCPARTAVVLAPPLLAYGCCGWVFFRGCAGSEGGGGHLAASRSASRSQRGGPVVVAIGSSPSGRRRRVVVVIPVIGTLFSSWRALAGAGYLLRGWGGQWLWLAGGYSPVGTFSFPSPFVAAGGGCCSHCRGRRCFPGGRGGGGVVGSG